MVYKKNFISHRKQLGLLPRVHLHPIKCVLFFPANWNLYVVNRCGNHTVFYLASVVYKFNFFLNPSSYHVTGLSRGLVELTFTRFNCSLFVFLSNIRQLMLILSVPFFKKLKFRGKGYYIYKNRRNTITPQFGYAHRIYVYSYFNIVRFLSKVKVFIFGLLKADVILASGEVRSKRPINIFTGRGVRFSRQVVYKKVGKVSSYR
jgi:hypothetical protein